MKKLWAAMIAAMCAVFPVSAGSQDSVGFVQPNIVPPYDTCRQDVTAAAEQTNAAMKASKERTYGAQGIADGVVSACRILKEAKWVLDKIPDCTTDGNYSDLQRLQDAYRKLANEINQKSSIRVWCD